MSKSEFENKIASEEAVDHYDNVLNSVNELKEKEAKALLKQVYARLDIVLNGNGEYDSQKFLKDLEGQFKELVEVTRKEKEKKKKETQAEE
ncbi:MULTISPECIES: hypothetical protein [Heyndrickxia]|uniref:hypothetical protein n=1 Tax=Heyndrickxia TaxID=2837504 RepID=UPI00040962A4|nr:MULTISPECIES: hypothetical protein [Heyndrickxia]MEC2304036.1 hypothetical protein [Weizmannia sp. CD-2023]MEC2339438.1 hypothetical protein [Weizmannia sp. CD-2023]